MPEEKFDPQDGLSESELARTRDPFCYYQTSPECREELADIRMYFKVTRDRLLELPECRHRSLALTGLEDALSLAIKARVFSHRDSVAVED